MSEEAADSRFRVGTIVAGKYSLTHTLGQGGMGLVVAATHLQLDRRVAIKFLLPQHLEKPDVVGRFTREARSAAKIQSDHVAHVLDVGVEDGTPYMVMEYLEGEDLKEALKRRGAFSVEEAVRHVMHASEAIAEAHSLGIVHRDLKPANLFLAKRANGKTILKVLDFGISKVMNPATETELTLTSRAVGSPSYMSPEQLTASRSLDGRADIWALGIVLYELLTRRRPFYGDSMPSIVAQILKGRYEKLDDLRPDLPLPVVHAVHRCLELEPADRFATVEELAAALAPFAPAESVSSLEGLPRPVSPSRASMPPLDESIPGHSQTGAASSMISPIPVSAQPRRTRLFAASGIATVAVLLAGAVIARSGRTSPLAGPPTTPVVASESPAEPPASAPLAAPPAASGATAALASASAAPAASDPAPPPAAPPAAPPVATGRSVLVRAPRATAAPAPTPATTAAAPPAKAQPECHAVSYFDALGDKHFKQECH